jgi:hypothetical protein
MKIYDKAAWHVDAGESEEEVLEKFNIVFHFLSTHDMLTLDGKEVCDMGVDSSVSLHEKLVTKRGNELLSKNYDTLLTLPISEIPDFLLSCVNNEEAVDIATILRKTTETSKPVLTLLSNKNAEIAN